MIRKATENDKMSFSFLANKFLEESQYPFKIDWDLFLDNYSLAINNPNFLVLVWEEEKKLVGMIVGGIASPLFSRDKVATELAWFVEKEHRDSKGSLKLLLEYEKWAKQKDCTFVTMVDIDTLNDLGKLYSRRGYTLTEKTYVKGLK